MKSFLLPHLPPPSLRMSALAGLGGCLAIAFVGALSALGLPPLLMAPFGASCVLLFSVPASPLSQPLNVIGGHLLSASIGLLAIGVLPEVWWAAALATGVAIGLMSLLRVTHPPAGANPLVIFAAAPGWDFLLFPVLAGAVVLVAVATIYHRAARLPYPAKRAA
jgi:CBS-domain-containing membrane protein